MGLPRTQVVTSSAIISTWATPRTTLRTGERVGSIFVSCGRQPSALPFSSRVHSRLKATTGANVSYHARMRARARARPRKSLGQHWLTDRAALRRIVDSMEIRDDETVIEIGAGTGLLTGLLAERARRLIPVEVDERLASRLTEKFAGLKNVTVVASDVLAVTPEELLTAGRGSLPYVVVGNLPYFIGTATVRRFLEASVRPRRLVVTLHA